MYSMFKPQCFNVDKALIHTLFNALFQSFSVHCVQQHIVQGVILYCTRVFVTLQGTDQHLIKDVFFFILMADVKHEIKLRYYMVMHQFVDVNKALINTFSVPGLVHVSVLCLVAHHQGVILDCIGVVLILQGTNQHLIKAVFFFVLTTTVKQEIQPVHSIVTHWCIDVDKASIGTFFDAWFRS